MITGVRCDYVFQFSHPIFHCDFFSLNFSIEIFLERSLHLYLTNSHLLMGSSKDEALFKNLELRFSLLLQTLCPVSMSY